MRAMVLMGLAGVLLAPAAMAQDKAESPPKTIRSVLLYGNDDDCPKSTNKDEIVTQYDMKSLDWLSLLKMDFLGLTTLTVIDEALRLLKGEQGIDLRPEELPLDDKETYALLSRGLTSGVFQFESSGMRDILRRYRPERLEDLIALNALYRPGPIQGGMISDFIDRRHHPLSGAHFHASSSSAASMNASSNVPASARNRSASAIRSTSASTWAPSSIRRSATVSPRWSQAATARSSSPAPAPRAVSTRRR